MLRPNRQTRFSYDVFEYLKTIKPGVSGELQLTDAVSAMIQDGKRVLAYTLQGKRHDTGTIKNYLKTVISLAFHDPVYKNIVHEVLKEELPTIML